MSAAKDPSAGRPLVGREDELAAVMAALDGIGRHGTALVLRGEAGIGKSALLGVGMDTARERDLRVLYTAGVETESGLPFAGLHRLLRPVIGGVERLMPIQRSALLAALGLIDEPAGDPLLVALAALELLSAQATERPIVVIADDLQWLDPASRDVIAFIGRRIEVEPIVVLGAVRDGYEQELGELRLPELALAALGPDAAAEVLDSRAVGLSPSLRERLLAEAAGNPLALVELPALATTGAADSAAGGAILPISARLERTFAKRSRDMPPETQAVLLIAAADEASSLPEICTAGEAMAGAPVSELSLEPAIHAGLVRVDGRRLSFRHPLVRSAIYQAADLDRRQAAHSALTEVLVDDPDRRAWHRAAATTGRDDDVAHDVEEMAWRAHGRGVMLQAALLLGRAAELTADVALRGQRLLKAGELAFQVGRADLVRGFVAEAQRLDLGSRESARVALLSEIFDDGVTGDVDRVRSLVEIARQVGSEGDADLALELLKGASMRCWWRAMGPAVRREVLAAAEELPVDATDPRLLVVVAIVAPIERGAAIVERVPQSLPAVSDAPPMAHLLGIAAHAVADHDTAMRILVPLADVLRKDGRLGLLAQVQSMLQWDAIMLGDWALAADCAGEGDRLARETGQPVWGAGLTCGLAIVAAIRGDEELAEELAAEAESVIIPHRMGDMHTVLLTARGVSALSAGRFEHAYALLARVFDPLDAAYHYREQFGAASFLADAAVMCGRTDEARAIVENLAETAAPSTAPALAFMLRYARAVLASDDEAEALHRDLLASGIEDRRFDVARLRLSYGRRLRRQGRGTEARELLSQARDAFDEVGAPSWGDRAQEELSATGEAVGARRREPWKRLTPQELQIALLAAAGRSDREIGLQLYLPHSTVAGQLERTLSKLGIASRSRLRELLPGSAGQIRG